MRFVLSICSVLLIAAGALNVIVSVNAWQLSAKVVLITGTLSTLQFISTVLLWHFIG